MSRCDFDKMFEILPNLYLSTYNQVLLADMSFFQVNCTKDLPMVQERGVRIAVDDDPYEASNMLIGLQDVLTRIDAELAVPDQRVIVHCLAAVSRSPTVICAYLMWKKGMVLDDAVAYVRGIRKEAFMFSMNFRDTLEKFGRTLQKSLNVYLYYSKRPKPQPRPQPHSRHDDLGEKRQYDLGEKHHYDLGEFSLGFEVYIRTNMYFMSLSVCPYGCWQDEATHMYHVPLCDVSTNAREVARIVKRVFATYIRGVHRCATINFKMGAPVGYAVYMGDNADSKKYDSALLLRRLKNKTLSKHIKNVGVSNIQCNGSACFCIHDRYSSQCSESVDLERDYPFIYTLVENANANAKTG